MEKFLDLLIPNLKDGYLFFADEYFPLNTDPHVHTHNKFEIEDGLGDFLYRNHECVILLQEVMEDRNWYIVTINENFKLDGIGIPREICFLYVFTADIRLATLIRLSFDRCSLQILDSHLPNMYMFPTLKI